MASIAALPDRTLALCPDAVYEARMAQALTSVAEAHASGTDEVGLSGGEPGV